MGATKMNLSRRNFLKGGAIGAVAVAAAGTLGACASPKAASSSESSKAASTSWKTAPAEVDSGKITNTYSCDAVIVGSGYAGVTAFRELSEEGYKAILVENSPKIRMRPQATNSLR